MTLAQWLLVSAALVVLCGRAYVWMRSEQLRRQADQILHDTSDRLIASLKAANDEKDQHIRTVHRLVAEERSSWALFYMPDNESADAKYWRVH